MSTLCTKAKAFAGCTELNHIGYPWEMSVRNTGQKETGIVLSVFLSRMTFQLSDVIVKDYVVSVISADGCYTVEWKLFVFINFITLTINTWFCIII